MGEAPASAPAAEACLPFSGFLAACLRCLSVGIFRLPRRSCYSIVQQGTLRYLVLVGHNFRTAEVRPRALILIYQIHCGRIMTFVARAPGLHLRAERQKEVPFAIRGKGRKGGARLAIRMHSPVFLGAGPGGRAALATRDAGRSRAAGTVPGNAGPARREAGAARADAPSPASAPFVGGRPAIAALGPFPKAAEPGHALSAAISGPDCARNAKNIKTTIKDMRANGRRAFAMLGESGGAGRQFEEPGGGGLTDDNHHFLEKSPGGEPGSRLVAGAAHKTAAEAGRAFAPTACDPDARQERAEGAPAALKNARNVDPCGHPAGARPAGPVARPLGGMRSLGIPEASPAVASRFEGGRSSAGRAAGQGGGAGRGGDNKA